MVQWHRDGIGQGAIGIGDLSPQVFALRLDQIPKDVIVVAIDYGDEAET
ncbi:hypothetical protein [Methylobacterium sp.]